MKEYLKNSSDVLAELNSSEAGLEQSEAEKRLAEHGENRLAQGKKESVFHKFLVQFSDPMIIILIVAAIVSAVTSAYNREFPADVIIIMIVVLINAVLGVYQETKAEKAIDALKEMAAAKSRVKRGGKTVLINSSMLVPGDVVALEAGDSVPADCRILHSASMKAEEAALTGESVPVEKSADEITAADGGDVLLGDRKNMCYMGSTVVYGRGKAVITATGMDTEMGKIADALSNAEQGQTPLQIKLSQLSKILTWLVLGICVIIFAVQLLRAGGFSFEVILNSFMIAVSLAVAAIPEGLAASVSSAV